MIGSRYPIIGINERHVLAGAFIKRTVANFTDSSVGLKTNRTNSSVSLRPFLEDSWRFIGRGVIDGNDLDSR